MDILLHGQQHKRSAFGFNRARMIHAALQRVISSVQQQKCNCLEIDEVAMHSFLGVPYVSVSAHPRHIQKGILFAGQTDRKAANVAPDDAAKTAPLKLHALYVPPTHPDETAQKTGPMRRRQRR